MAADIALSEALGLGAERHFGVLGELASKRIGTVVGEISDFLMSPVRSLGPNSSSGG
jgi:hypothetical protein